MAKRTGGKQGKKTTGTAKGWAALTWSNLDDWAGGRSVMRGRAYQRQGRVKDLSIAEDGRLLATVQGGQRYVVAVWLNAGNRRGGKLGSHCTCPVGYDCKHAVATVAAYLQALTDATPVPTAEPDDPRWHTLSDEGFDDDIDDWDDDEFEDDELEQMPPKRRQPQRLARSNWDTKIAQFIRGKSREELADQVLSLVQRYPDLREEFRERIALSEGDAERLVAQARNEMRERTSEIGWRNHWNGEGHIPDYSRLKHRLERLAELGQADAVVELGREFIGSAISQVEQSHDEGETAQAVAECLPVVFDALLKSSLSAPQTILYAIDACLKDGYNLVDDSVGVVLDARWKPADWSAVADELARRLQQQSGTADDDSWHRKYQRDRLSDWLLTALDNAGRGGERRAIYETEARTTGSYERLVRHLIAEKQFEDAERWAKEGIDKTREKWPGVASMLANSLCEVARGRRQWDVVAAHAACQFFEHPSRRGFNEIVSMAAKAKCGDKVRAAALRFLETGKSPFHWRASRKGSETLQVDSAWPLPVPGYLVPLLRPDPRRLAPPGPHHDVLLDMAIAAKQPDEILRWYDKLTGGRKPNRRGWGWADEGTADRVAAAVAKSHPERALEIYRRELDAALPHADARCYESAAKYLRLMRPIMKSLGQQADWKTLLAEIRQKYRNRPRFMEILDKLDGRTILQTKRAKKRR